MSITGADLAIIAVGAGEVIVFTCGQHVKLDGQSGPSSESRVLVGKEKDKYQLYDFTERGNDEQLGLPVDDGTPAPFIDQRLATSEGMLFDPGRKYRMIYVSGETMC